MSKGAGEQHAGSTAAGVGLILLTLAGWTVAPIFIKYFASEIDAWTSNGWRYGFAAVLWAPLLIGLRLGKKWPAGLMRAALVPAAFNAAAQAAFTSSFYLIDPGMVAFGLRVQMVFTAVGAFMLFPAERPVIGTWGFIAGVLAVVAGTAGTVIFQHGGLSSRDSVVGVGLAIAAGAGFAGYALGVRKCMSGYRSMAAFAAISQYTALVQVVLMLALGERFGLMALEMTAPQFGLLLLSSVIGIALAHVLYYMAIERLGVAVSTGIIQLQPFTVAAVSIPMFGEVLTGWQWVAGGVAVGGAIAMVWVQHRHRKREAAQRRGAGFKDLPPDHVAAAVAGESGEAVTPGARG